MWGTWLAAGSWRLDTYGLSQLGGRQHWRIRMDAAVFESLLRDRWLELAEECEWSDEMEVMIWC